MLCSMISSVFLNEETVYKFRFPQTAWHDRFSLKLCKYDEWPFLSISLSTQPRKNKEEGGIKEFAYINIDPLHIIACVQ